jgi:8-amino-7-oxononanoate synthase
MDKLLAKLTERQNIGNLRTLTTSKGRIDFFSNDYLGLARNKVLSIEIAQEYARFDNKINGSTGSRLLAGHSQFFEELESRLAEIFLAEKALIFNSGYNANLAILSCVPQRGDTIIHDELIHASLIDGARLSFAKRFSFKHNDLNDLERVLFQSSGDKFVVVESIYSMDGDTAPLKELVQVCEKHGAYLIVDEAHSTGVMGASGAGMVAMLGLDKQVFARIMTFGKGMGVHGACICGSKTLIDYLINFARAFIYTTAMPLHGLVSIDQAFKFLRKNENLQTQLNENVQYFLSCAASTGLEKRIVPSQSAIQVVKVSGNNQARFIADKLMGLGFDIRAILSPTVKEGEERIRICLHSFNEKEDIFTLAEKTKEHL